MPRRTNATLNKRRSTSAPERGGGSSKPRRLSTRDVDVQVVAMREGGDSFSAIARKLELGRAVDAHRCFVRSLGALDTEQRQQVIANEEARYDLLEIRIRERDAADPAKIERRLLGVEKYREAIRQ